MTMSDLLPVRSPHTEIPEQCKVPLPPRKVLWSWSAKRWALCCSLHSLQTPGTFSFPIPMNRHSLHQPNCPSQRPVLPNPSPSSIKFTSHIPLTPSISSYCHCPGSSPSSSQHHLSPGRHSPFSHIHHYPQQCSPRIPSSQRRFIKEAKSCLSFP